MQITLNQIKIRGDNWAAGSKLKTFIWEFLLFGIKQGWACLFGGLMLALIIATFLFYPTDAQLARYDFLFLAAIIIQILLLVFKLETTQEAKVILIFHIIGTVMEIFKTHVGSWIYPEDNFFRIGGVPLFSGFMYAAVGSYIARVWNIFDFKFSSYPPVWQTYLLATLIYINFFSHHYIIDIRYALFAASAFLFGKIWIYYTPNFKPRRMPLIVGFVLVALFIWFAENIGTFTAAWVYPEQRDGWSVVSISKLGSWYLLMLISFVLVTLIKKPHVK